MTFTHAGVVSYRIVHDQVQFLVVSSSTGEHWVLPRGHIEPGETADAAALRELKEEAGITGEIVERLRPQRFEKQGETVVAQYYLTRALAETQATEKRTLRWVDETSALGLLSFEEARRVLREGASRIPKMHIR